MDDAETRPLKLEDERFCFFFSAASAGACDVLHNVCVCVCDIAVFIVGNHMAERVSIVLWTNRLMRSVELRWKTKLGGGWI